MIYKFLKIIACMLLLFGSIALHAQDDPGTDFEDEDGNVDSEGLESPSAPIDSQILYLAAAGTALAFYRYRLIKPDSGKH